MAKKDKYDEDDQRIEFSASNLNITNILQNDINGIFGIPYQFLDTVDRRIPNTSIGAKYGEKIISKMPLLFLTPCKPKLMKGSSTDDIKKVVQALISSGEGASTDTIKALLGSIKTKNRYYTTEFAYSSYYAKVNALCQELSYFMGIADEKVPINGKTVKIKNINWQKIKNDSFNKYFAASRAVVTYVDGLSSLDDSFQNSTTESSLASTINGYSDQVHELRFLLGENSTAGALATFAGGAVDFLNNGLGNLVGAMGSSLLGNLTKNGIDTIISGGKLSFPKIWSDSDFSRSYSFSVKLRSPEHDPISLYFNIMVPFIHYISMTLPITITLGDNDDPNGYTTPFLLKAYAKGMFNIDMGIISGLSCTRGATGQWDDNGIPTQMDINITIDDLYSKLFLPNVKPNATSDILPFQNSAAVKLVANTAMMDYLANLAGLNVANTELARKTQLLIYLYSTNVTNVPSKIWSNFDNAVANAISNLYQF